MRPARHELSEMRRRSNSMPQRLVRVAKVHAQQDAFRIQFMWTTIRIDRVSVLQQNLAFNRILQAPENARVINEPDRERLEDNKNGH